MRTSRWRIAGALATGAVASLALLTVTQLAPLPASLDSLLEREAGAIVSRDGEWLASRYAGAWNAHARVADSASGVPPLLAAAIVAAEDKRFWSHRGPDWLARAHALWQNLRAGRVVRGASTISEQVVRMVYPRPRTPWSRWLEGFDAWRFEHRFGKAAVFAFYLDQVPYGGHRRGVRQASAHYFDRDLSSATVSELLALAVLPRAPSRLDPARNPRGLVLRTRRLAATLHAAGHLNDAELARRRRQGRWSDAAPPTAPAGDAAHFVALVRERLDGTSATRPPRGRWRATLDGELQQHVQAALRARLADLRAARVGSAAALVFAHRSGAVRAWTTVSADGHDSTIDAVRVPRLAGSTLKPLLYAVLLDAGSTPATRLSDAALVRPVGRGLHVYRNYGRAHFGDVSLREALGSSLNLPAVRVLGELGPDRFLATLRGLGLHSLTAHAAHYGEGLALGNAEVSLLALGRAYGALARGGRSVRLRALETAPVREGERVYSRATAATVRELLGDAGARELEFRRGGVLDMPRGIAVKTGTSSGHRDAWTVAFDARHVVAVWMGNLDGQPMRGVSGAGGPAVAVRAIMAALAGRGAAPRPSPAGAAPHAMSAASGPALAAGAAPTAVTAGAASERDARAAPRIVLPSDGLAIAMDPRIPDSLEALALTLDAVPARSQVEWWLNGERLAQRGNHAAWPVQPGEHELRARVFAPDGQLLARTRAVRFSVRPDT